MRKYRSLVVWQRAHRLSIDVLRTTDRCYHPRSRSVFDQLRRAALSVEANIVEGYALSTPLQFRRHLRIALGSAAEVECFLEIVGELEYLPRAPLDRLTQLIDLIIGNLFGLVRKGLHTKVSGLTEGTAPRSPLPHSTHLARVAGGSPHPTSAQPAQPSGISHAPGGARRLHVGPASRGVENQA